MPLLFDHEIREHLARYLAGEITLQAFEDWFVPASWNVHRSGNDEAARLTYEIEAVLLQAAAERWPEQRVKDRLAPFVENYTVTLGEHLPIRVATASRTERYDLPSGVKAEPAALMPVVVHRISVTAS